MLVIKSQWGQSHQASTTPRWTTGSSFSTRQGTLFHRSVEISAEIRDEFQTACIEFLEVDPLHRPGSPRLYMFSATLRMLSPIR